MDKEKQDEESFECMRRKLWRDVLLHGLSVTNERTIALCDEVVEKFDERFGKGEGE